VIWRAESLEALWDMSQLLRNETFHPVQPLRIGTLWQSGSERRLLIDALLRDVMLMVGELSVRGAWLDLWDGFCVRMTMC
jgi:hypothetical protein